MIDCPAPEVPETVQIALVIGGRTLAGDAIVRLDAETSLTLLAPGGGIELFTWRNGEVTTGLDAWRPWLEKLPIERDLRLAFTVAAEGRCRAGGGVLTVKGPETRWCGPGGRARSTRSGATVTVTDRRYTLTVAHAPR